MDNLHKDVLFSILLKVDFLSVCRLKQCCNSLNKVLTSKVYWDYRIKHEVGDKKLPFPDNISPEEKYICAVTQAEKCMYGKERYIYIFDQEIMPTCGISINTKSHHRQ